MSLELNSCVLIDYRLWAAKSEGRQWVEHCIEQCIEHPPEPRSGLCPELLADFRIPKPPGCSQGEPRGSFSVHFFSDRFWQFGEGLLQQRDRDRRDVGVARLVGAFPTILRVPLEAQQRKVRGAPPLLGVVTHLGSFLTAIDRQHRAVQIEDRSGGWSEHGCPPTVVQLQQGLASRTSEPLEETPQTGGFGIPRQTSQVVKHSVVAQRLGGFDSPQAQNQWVEQSLQRFADTVAVVALSESNVPPERALQVDALEELLDQSHSAELGQADSIGSNAKISRSTGHCCQTAFLMRIHNKGQDSQVRGCQQGFLQCSCRS